MFSVLLVCSVLSFAQTVTEQFLVKGNCGQCKARIEKAALKAGATTANWTASNQTLTMTLDESKVKCDDILKQIAEVGHDNEKFKHLKKLIKICLLAVSTREVLILKNQMTHLNITQILMRKRTRLKV